MRKVFGLAVLVIMGCLAACSNYKYYSVGTNQANLQRYSTFAWLPPVRRTAANTSSPYVRDIADQKIKTQATAELQERGLCLRSGKPDLLVRYNIMVDEKEKIYNEPQYQYVGGGYYGGYGFYGGRGYYYNVARPYPVYVGSEVERIPYKEGTVMIDLIDRRSGKVIWRGYGIGEVNNAERAVNDLPKVVDGIFEKLPMAATVKS